MSDFRFSPASLTVHVGDTVTWTNAGPAQHTATASDHSFDTGILARGASASHTFSTAGTFAYICTIHQFMRGTVVVLAATTTSTPSTTPTTTPGTTTPTTTPTSSAGGLPNTGLDLAATVLIGLLLGGVGLLLRRPARSVPQTESGEGRTPDR
ncbi:MAG TPA: cupredoxin family copper-binding protein [Solirubrobacteraceae bacterium]